MAQGIKHDGGKPRFTLLPWSSVRHVVDALEFGARKYGVDNWQRVDDARKRYTDAALRHVIALADGERNDPESGLYHAAHAACCLLFLMWFDDREKRKPLEAATPIEILREDLAHSKALKTNRRARDGAMSERKGEVLVRRVREVL